MKNRWVYLLVLLGIAAGALALRLPRLAARPMHNDEAVNAVKFNDLWTSGKFAYDPNEYHGPTLYYVALPLLAARGLSYANATEADYRLPVALLGAAMVLLPWLLRDGIGPTAVAGAACLMAVSTAMVFYSRYFIQEILLVFFSALTIAAGWKHIVVNLRRNRREEILTSPSPASATPSAGHIIWDPFCGSGLELIERALLGNVSKIIGTDLSPAALEIAQQNFAAANLQNIQTQFVASDFRHFDPGPVSLIITNPPLGKRVPIPNLRQLIADLFDSAARFLKPGGCLIFANPLKQTPTQPSLRREFSQLIDFGGFHCRLEKYSKP